MCLLSYTSKRGKQSVELSPRFVLESCKNKSFSGFSCIYFQCAPLVLNYTDTYYMASSASGQDEPNRAL